MSVRLIVLSLLFAALARQIVNAAEFVPLAMPSGAISSRALAISAEGNYAVGSVTYATGITEAVRWSLVDNTVMPLGWLPNGGQFSEAVGISANGTTIVGRSDSFDWDYEQPAQEGFIWRPKQMAGVGYSNVGPFNGGRSSEVMTVSRDGRAMSIAFHQEDEINHISRSYYQEPDGYLVSIGDIRVSGMAGADGYMFVGGSAYDMPFRGDEAVPQRIPIGNHYGHATAISYDATSIVGYFYTDVARQSTTAFRWHGPRDPYWYRDYPFDGRNLTYLAPLSSNESLKAHAVSDDGLVIVGESVGASGSEAFFWQWSRSEGGLTRKLETVLAADFGISIGDWNLGTASGLSATGRQIVGTGRNPAGGERAYLVDLTPSYSVNFSANGGVSSFTSVSGYYWFPFGSSLNLSVANACDEPCDAQETQMIVTPRFHFTDPSANLTFKVSAPKYDPDNGVGQLLDYWAVDLCSESDDTRNKFDCTELYNSRNDSLTTAFPFFDPFWLKIPLPSEQIVPRKSYNFRFRSADPDTVLTLGPLAISEISLDGGSTLLSGDATYHGVVDHADLASLMASFGKTSGSTWADGDFNGDGRVNLRDLMLLRGRMLQPASAAPIPEPSATVLAMLALVMASIRKWSRKAGVKK